MHLILNNGRTLANSYLREPYNMVSSLAHFLNLERFDQLKKPVDESHFALGGREKSTETVLLK